MSMRQSTNIKSVIILGSGGQKIGQSGEFDFAGLQAIRALKQSQIRTILVNPNMTAAQTLEGFADATYFIPITAEFVSKILDKEKPDALIAGFGGKTAFECALELDASGILEKYNVRVLGTPLLSMNQTNDRSSFVSLMKESHLPITVSKPAETIDAALTALQSQGFPVLVRSGSRENDSEVTVAASEQALIELAERALADNKPLFIEEWLGGWKEVEVEVLRDAEGNCETACVLENIDPVGIHSGDSLVIAPAQTLYESEIRTLNAHAHKAAGILNILGSSSFRFALSQETGEIRLLEASARVSRTTSLAAKATGIPIPFLSIQLALGILLRDLSFQRTGDHIALKMPRWDLDKFRAVDRHIGSGMKSVGEALAFGRTFAEALQKAVRMSTPSASGLACHPFEFRDIKEALRNPTDLRIFAVYQALLEGWSADRVWKYTRIDRWYIAAMAEIAETETRLKSGQLPSRELLLHAKRLGFSDEQIALAVKARADKIRALRKELAVRPVVKSGGGKNLYMTYNGMTDDIQPSEKGSLIPGSGPYRIGSSFEYDWCCTSALRTMRKAGHHSIMVNCNPEAVTTDGELADRLYFEELSLERILDIYEAERPANVLLSYGGPAAAKLAPDLTRLGLPLAGTAGADIERAVDRNKFSALLDELNIRQPEWAAVSNYQEAKAFAQKVAYPVLVRTLRNEAGSAMNVAWDDASLKTFLTDKAVITKFVENSKEIEIDAVAKNGEILVYAISEHLENAGVHSGDATVVLPAQRIYLSTAQAIKKASRKIVKALDITGPFNIQFLAKNAAVQVIECTVRASRSLPFCSSVFRIDMVDMAVRAQLGLDVQKVDGSALDFDHVGVRAAQFSYARLKGADPVAGVEMSSTGEVGCLGRGVRDAFMKALLSTGYRVPKKRILLSTGPIEDKVDFIDSAKKLKAMGYELCASGGTARFLQNHDIETETLAWPLDDKKPNIADAIARKEIDLVINIPKNNRETELRNDFIIRRMSVDHDIPLITNIKIAKQFTDALEWYKTRGLDVKSREEYR